MQVVLASKFDRKMHLNLSAALNLTAGNISPFGIAIDDTNAEDGGTKAVENFGIEEVVEEVLEAGKQNVDDIDANDEEGGDEIVGEYVKDVVDVEGEHDSSGVIIYEDEVNKDGEDEEVVNEDVAYVDVKGVDNVVDEEVVDVDVLGENAEDKDEVVEDDEEVEVVV